MKLALQLYTLRDCYKTKEEFKNVLLQVKEMGYDGVEFAGYHDIPARELRDYLTEVGLQVISCHHGIHELEEKAQEIVDYVNELGCPNLVCSYSETATMEQVEHTVEVLKKVTEIAKEYKIKIGYHNHSHEFVPLKNGQLPIDMIKEACKLQVDTYWVFHAIKNPVVFLKENANRVLLVHIKDGDLQGNPLALGEGENYIPAIMEEAKKIGMEWVIVENDNPKPDGLSDVKRSIEYLKRISN